jgi:hypothetical protein
MPPNSDGDIILIIHNLFTSIITGNNQNGAELLKERNEEKHSDFRTELF